MTLRRTLVVTLFGLLGLSMLSHTFTQADEAQTASNVSDAREPIRLTQAEARRQAELLHETFHFVLHEVHHQYYREDEGLTLPAVTLDRVFDHLKKQRGVEIHWLAVDAKSMNVDHEPRTEFEKSAVKALVGGADEYEKIEQGLYRRVGKIVLTSECLKCHLPARTSNKNRAAGLSIAIPVRMAD